VTTLEILRGMRELLAEESRWTREYYGRYRDGEGCTNGYDDGACCWCLMGAAEKVSGERDPGRIERVFIKVLGGRTSGDIFTWNDAPERTHAEILAALDRAIALESGAS